MLDVACKNETNEKGIDLKELSARMGIPEKPGRSDNLYSLRTGRTPVDVEKLSLICNYFQIKPHALIYHIEESLKNQ
jgi:transcriptional regulator with XRE-family HTH domain